MIRMMYVSLIIIVVLSVSLLAVLLLNRAPLWLTPGPWERVKIYLTRNIAETQPDSRFPELRPVKFKAPPTEVYDAVLKAIPQLGWTQEQQDRQAMFIHAVVTTPLWKFKDDVWIEVKTDASQQAILSVRAQSRVGKGDLAANTRHVRDLFDQVDTVLEATKASQS